MKRITFSSTIIALLFAAAAAAQDPPAIILARYDRCNVAQQARADELLRTVVGPVAQKRVDAGQLTGWALQAHVQGGAWRRIFVLLGTDLDAMMDASAEIVREMQEQHADVAAEMGAICPSHDDYIWITVAGSGPNPDPVAAAVSISTYYICDVAREGRVDQIFQDLMAPIYEKHTGMGHLAGWSFYSHRSGGQYRRLETFSGVDHKTLLNMQNTIYTEAQDVDPLAFNEFRQICNAHVDYMWRNATTG